MIEKRKKFVGKYDKSKGIYKSGILFNDPSSKINPTRDGKIKGIEINDGCLIEIYLKYRDFLGTGDKSEILSPICGNTFDNNLFNCWKPLIAF